MAALKPSRSGLLLDCSAHLRISCGVLFFMIKITYGIWQMKFQLFSRTAPGSIPKYGVRDLSNKGTNRTELLVNFKHLMYPNLFSSG